MCHETEPFCAAYRLERTIVASACLHRLPGGRTVVLSPCGVLGKARDAWPQTLVAVAGPSDACAVVWKTLRDVLPDYWMTAFPDEINPGWIG